MRKQSISFAQVINFS